jgi:hypothetical protein
MSGGFQNDKKPGTTTRGRQEGGTDELIRIPQLEDVELARLVVGDLLLTRGTTSEERLAILTILSVS